MTFIRPPPEAMAKINAAMKDVDRGRQRFVRQEMATEYLDAWKASGLEPEDDEHDGEEECRDDELDVACHGRRS